MHRANLHLEQLARRASVIHGGMNIWDVLGIKYEFEMFWEVI